MTKSSKHKAQTSSQAPAAAPRRSTRVSQAIIKQVTNQPAKRNLPTDERKNQTVQQLILQKSNPSQNSKKSAKQSPSISKMTLGNKSNAFTTNTSSLAQHQKPQGRQSQGPTVYSKNSGQKFEGDLTIIECPEELAPRRVLTMDNGIAGGPPQTRSKISSLTAAQPKSNILRQVDTQSSKVDKGQGEASPQAKKAVTASWASQIEVSPHIQDSNGGPIIEIQQSKKGSSPAGKTTAQGNSASRVGDFISKMEYAEETTKMQQSHLALETNSVHDIAADASSHYLKPINVVANPRQRLSSLCTDNLLEDDTEFKRPLEPGSPAMSRCPQSYTGNAEDNSRPITMHPLVQVVDDFTTQRQLALAAVNNQRGDSPHHQIQKPRIEDFIARFENEMKVTEHAYKHIQAQKKKANELYQRGLSQGTLVQQPLRNNQFGQLMQPSTSWGYIGANSMQLSNNSPNLPQFGSLMSIRPPQNPSTVSVDNHVSGQVSVGLETTSQLEQYEAYRFQPNQLMPFYPKSVQKLLARRHKLNSIQQTSERLTANLKAPSVKFKNSQKSVSKLRNLVLCQTNFMQVLLQKIDRRSKPIKKQERMLREHLKRKRIQLEEENFDIIGVLKQAIKSQPDSQQSGPTNNENQNAGSKYDGTKNYQLAQCDELQHLMRKDVQQSISMDVEMQQLMVPAESKQELVSLHNTTNNQANLYSFKKSVACAGSQQKSQGYSTKKQLNVDFQQSRNRDSLQNTIANIGANPIHSSKGTDSKSDLIRARGASETDPNTALNLTTTASEQFKTAEAKVKEAFRLSEIGDTIFQPLTKMLVSTHNQLPNSIELPQTPRLASEGIPQQKGVKPQTPQSFKSPPRTISVPRKPSQTQEELISDLNSSKNDLIVKQKSSCNSKTQKVSQKQIAITATEHLVNSIDQCQLKSQKSSIGPAATTSQKRKSKNSKTVQQHQPAQTAQSVIEGRDLGQTFAEMIDVGNTNGNFSIKFRINGNNAQQNQLQQPNDSSLNNGTDTTGPGTDSCVSAINQLAVPHLQSLQNGGSTAKTQSKTSRQKSNLQCQNSTVGKGQKSNQNNMSKVPQTIADPQIEQQTEQQAQNTLMNQQMNLQMESTQAHLMPSDAVMMAGQAQYEAVTQMQNYFIPQHNNFQTYNMHQGTNVQIDDPRLIGNHLNDISSSILNKNRGGMHASFLQNLSNDVNNLLIDDVVPQPTVPVGSNSAFFDKSQVPSSVGTSNPNIQQQHHQNLEDFLYRQQQLPPSTPAACIIPQGIDLNLSKSQSHHPFGKFNASISQQNNTIQNSGVNNQHHHHMQNFTQFGAVAVDNQGADNFSIEHFIADNTSLNHHHQQNAAINANGGIGAYANNNLTLNQSHSMMLPQSAQKTSSNEQGFSYGVVGTNGHNLSNYANMLMDVDGLPNYSNVANPYEAAKRRYMREQQQHMLLQESNTQRPGDKQNLAAKNENSCGINKQQKATTLLNTVTPLNLHTSPDNCKNGGGPDMTMMLQPFTVNQNERAVAQGAVGMSGTEQNQANQNLPVGSNANVAQNQQNIHNQMNGSHILQQQAQSVADFKLSASSALKNSAAMGACLDSAGLGIAQAAVNGEDEEMIGGEVEHSMKIDVQAVGMGAMVGVGHNINQINQHHQYQHHTDVAGVQPHNQILEHQTSSLVINRHHHMVQMPGGGLPGVVSAWSTNMLDQAVDNEQNWGCYPQVSPRYLQPYSSHQID